MSGTCVDQEVFRSVIGHFASGVTVITCREGDRDFGMTASAVTSLSMEPPMVLVCIHKQNPTGAAIASTGRFVVNILREDQGHLALRFAAPSDDKFSGLAERRGTSGARILPDVLAHLECRVEESTTGGTHSVLMSAVEVAEAHGGAPLAYFRGTFGRLDLAHDDALYVELRERVLSRKIPLGKRLEVEEVAQLLGADSGSTLHALTRLTAEGVVSREGAAFTVTPLNVEVVERAFRVRTVIELGAAARNIGNVSQDDLAELRRLAEVMNPGVVDDHGFGPREYFEANGRFHELPIKWAGGDELVSAYRHLAIDGILVRSMRGYRKDAEAITRDLQDHSAIVSAYEAGDVSAAQGAIVRHAERASRLVKTEVELAGGAL